MYAIQQNRKQLLYGRTAGTEDTIDSHTLTTIVHVHNSETCM